MMRKVKFQEGGVASSGISNEPVGAALRRLFRRSEPMQGPPAPSSSGQRPQEDRARMAAEAAAEFDREEAALAERARQRRNRPSAITNQPVGERLAGRRPAPAPEPQAAGRSYPIGEGGTLQPESTQRPPAAPSRPRATPRPMAREATTAEDLNEIVLRLTRGEKPVTETEKRIADRMGIAYRKGGMVKAKKMKSGGKVAPKKMMKGGMTSKPKKMMGGGRAMYAKGGMAKGCK